jgi:hypothetical protein
VVREGVGAGGEMNQALYVHMNNKRKKKKKIGKSFGKTKQTNKQTNKNNQCFKKTMYIFFYKK